jgi:hypothetical protein
VPLPIRTRHSSKASTRSPRPRRLSR